MDISKLLQKKRRAQGNGNMKIIAEVSKELGDIYFQTEKYLKALNQYKDQVEACESLDDALQTAVGNRMIGEVLTSLGRFEDALKYQNLYLERAIELNDLIEQQRAHAGLGRTHFCMSHCLEDKTKKKEALNAAKIAYLTSLKTCDKFETSGVNIHIKEVMTMRARLLLNLGLVLEAKQHPEKGKVLMEKAAQLCEQNGLDEDLHRTNISLGKVHEDVKDYSSAQEFYRKAANIEDPILKESAYLHEAELLVKWGKWSKAREMLVQLYVHHNNSSGNHKKVSKLLKIVAIIQSCEEKLLSEENNQTRLELYETMGDAASVGNAFETALDYYRNMLACAEIGDIQEKIGTALVSVAQTLKDLEKYDEALVYAKKELQLCKDPKEICRSALCLKDLLILSSSPESHIQEAFGHAWKNAEKSGNLALKLSVLQSRLDYCISKGEKDTSKLRQNIAEIQEMTQDDESSDEEDLETSLKGINIEIDELLDVEEEMQKKEGNTVRKKRVPSIKFKKTSHGEMPLQVACIDGDKKKVAELLKQGHPVNCRDYCGWTPLHEAANHGFLEIVKLLVNYGVNINDRGGHQCGKLTPLHDAATCGHIDVVDFLIEKGADPRLKTAKGDTVLDCLEEWKRRVGELSPEDEARYQIVRNKLKAIIPRATKPSSRGADNSNTPRDSLTDSDADTNDLPMIPPDLPRKEKISAGEDYRRTIESLKSNRSRIMTPSSSNRNVEPLIDSEELIIDEDNWLEEDVKIPTAKKRRSAPNLDTPGSVKRKSITLTPNEDKNPKRRRNNDNDEVECLEDSENSRDSGSSENFDIFTASTSNSSRFHRTKSKQKSLLTSGFTRTLESRTPSPVFHQPDSFGTQLRGQRVDNQSRQHSVKVEIELDNRIIKTKLRIEDDSINIIEALMNDVVGKFEEMTGCRGRIELTTSSGGVIEADNILNIIYKNDGVLRLAGRVLDLQVPSLVDRFEKFCRAMRIDGDDPELVRSLKSCKNTGIFRLKSDECLDLLLMPILKSLEYEKSLQVLHLSSGILYNLGESVNETLDRLTSLQELHLQGCDIDHQFLRAIDHLPPQLRVLDMGYNPLGPQSQDKLGELIAPLKCLQTLNLRCCGLERFPATSISSSLVNLDVSGNFIQGESVEFLLEKQIINLSISNTYSPENSIQEVLMRGMKSIFMSLETLEVTGCNLTNVDVLQVMEKCQNLSKFVLGDNPEVSQVALEALIGRRPTFILIDMTGCGKITAIPSLGLRIQNPSVCTLMASFSEEVCNSWRNLWSRQAMLYNHPHDVVIIRPFT
ncbi:tonsoku-like protein [Fopius arisanus]|uniref:Tonsoku-like protein n=1 Tax=Fopius arisanus TaxID=64838 RepID=A0A9R1TDL8_9HYME|nr:PREDICTED: tonsoku-like protein [Fopius arisanus]